MKTLLLIGASISLLVLGACSHGHGDKKSCNHDKKQEKMHEKIQEKWKAMDKDGDGALSKIEFNNAHAEKFKEMDGNSDGKVTMEEKMAFIKAKHSSKDHGEKSCRHCKKHEKMDKKWKAMDKNGDNAVSKTEFDQAHAEMFIEMDSDSDGKVTIEEKMVFMKAKCGCR